VDGGAMPAEGHKSRRAALALFAGAPALATLTVTAIAAASVGPAPPEKKIATSEQLAAMEFEPLHDDGEMRPTDETAEAIIVSARLAWLTMHKTKAELEDVARNLGDEAFEAMVNGFIEHKGQFQALAELLGAAEVRLMCAAASALAKDDPEEFANV
jgi:hypothetical protein